MTDKNLTEIVAILDRSGSMSGLIAETIGGFNNFVSEQQKNTVGKALLTLVQFDDQYQIDYNGVDINDVKPLDNTTYVPRGWTALLDAIGKTINSVGERLAKTDEDKRPGQVIFLIITDGEENSSKEFKKEAIKEMVDKQTDEYNWTFVFLGGGTKDFDSSNQAAALGIASQNSYKYSTNNSVGTQALYSNLSRGVSRRRSADPADPIESFLTEDEKKALIE